MRVERRDRCTWYIRCIKLTDFAVNCQVKCSHGGTKRPPWKLMIFIDTLIFEPPP